MADKHVDPAAAAGTDAPPELGKGPSCLAHQTGMQAVHEQLLPIRNETHPPPPPPPAEPEAAPGPATHPAAAEGPRDDQSEAPSEIDEQILDPELMAMLQDPDALAMLKERGLVDDREDGPDDFETVGTQSEYGGFIDAVEMASLKGAAHTAPVHCVAISPVDPGLLATGGEDDTAFLWRVGDLPEPGAAEELKPIAELKGHSDTVIAVAWSADGKFLATGGMDGRVLLWQPDGTKVATMEDLGDAVNYLFWHPKGNMLFAGGADLQSAMWNDRGVCLQLFAGHVSEVTCGCLTLDGKHLVTGSEDNTVRVFAPKTGEQVAQFGNRVKGMSDFPFSPVRSLVPHVKTADVVCAGFDDGKICLLSVSNKRILQVLDGGHKQAVEAISFSKSLPYYVSVCGDGSIALWAQDGNKLRHFVKQDEGVVNAVWHQNSFFTADTGAVLAKWDGRCVDKPEATWTGHTNTLLCLAIHPEAKWMVTGSDDFTIRIFRAAP